MSTQDIAVNHSRSKQLNNVNVSQVFEILSYTFRKGKLTIQEDLICI